LSVAEETVRRPRSTARDWARMAVLAGVTAVVFYLIFRNVPFHDVLARLRTAHTLPLLMGALLTVTFPIFSALRMEAVLAGIGRRIELGRAFTIIMAGFTFSTFTPSKGGDLARAWFLRGRAPVSSVLGSVLAERLLDVLTLLAFCLVGSLVFHWNTLALLSGALLVCGILGTTLLLTVHLPIPAKLRPKVERLLESLRVLLRRPGLFVYVLSLTLANWLASIIQAWLFYRSLGCPMPFARVLAALPAAIFVGLVPITIAGMGTRDSALIRLLAAQAAPEISLAVGMLYSLFGYWLPGLVGLPFLRSAMRGGSASPGEQSKGNKK
jgi:glycosyltransferase 2 family protein